MVSFELMLRNNSKKSKFLSTSSILNKLNNLSLEQDNLESAFRNWIDSLVTVSGVSIKNGIKPNDQGFYDD